MKYTIKGNLQAIYNLLDGFDNENVIGVQTAINEILSTLEGLEVDDITDIKGLVTSLGELLEGLEVDDIAEIKLLIESLIDNEIKSIKVEDIELDGTTNIVLNIVDLTEIVDLLLILKGKTVDGTSLLKFVLDDVDLCNGTDIDTMVVGSILNLVKFDDSLDLNNSTIAVNKGLPFIVNGNNTKLKISSSTDTEGVTCDLIVNYKTGTIEPISED
jgi:hypothetical protein